ncbi:hypothetical protein HYV79_04800 [Candidatus Woesearchaeota archaeon]|nr:hypothetical protein [Candidatus Woesearchaeota archaeon]
MKKKITTIIIALIVLQIAIAVEAANPEDTMLDEESTADTSGEVIIIPSVSKDEIELDKDTKAKIISGKAEIIPKNDVDKYKKYDPNLVKIEDKKLIKFITENPDLDYSKVAEFIKENKEIKTVAITGLLILTSHEEVKQKITVHPKLLWWEAKEQTRTLIVEKETSVDISRGTIETTKRSVKDENDVVVKEVEVTKEFDVDGLLQRESETRKIGDEKYSIEKKYEREKHLSSSKITFDPITVSGELKGKKVTLNIKGVELDSQGNTRVVLENEKISDVIDSSEVVGLLKDKPEIRKQVMFSIAAAPGANGWVKWYNRAFSEGFWGFMGGSLKAYEQFKGLSTWTNLIQDKSYVEWKESWREKVSSVFCAISGIGDCFKSAICERYARSPGGGTVIGEFKGSPRSVVKIVADKSLQLDTPEGKAHYYRVTYYLANPTQQTMSYNLYFITDKGEKIPWFIDEKGNTAPQQILAGSAVGRSADSPLISRPSTKNYVNICLEFSPRIIKSNKSKTGSHCAGPIPSYSGSIQTIEKQKQILEEKTKEPTKTSGLREGALI